MTRNVAASVHQRLLNLSRAQGRPFNELLQYYALERFLYRLGDSSYRDHFVLKGALMFTVWETLFPRSTRDIDLLGHLDNTPERIVAALDEICHRPVTDDGLRFAAETLMGERIIQGADYEGVRVRFMAYLGLVRIPMQIDVGFGDLVVPAPVPIRIPPLLDFSAPEILGYSRESAIAEKLQSMVRLGEINSRMKDFFDIWLLAGRYHFDGTTLERALLETFRRRRTPLTSDPIAFRQTFTHNPDKQAQWEAFLRRNAIQGTEVPSLLSEAVALIAAFLLPVLRALIEGSVFNSHWSPGGPWAEEDSGPKEP